MYGSLKGNVQSTYERLKILLKISYYSASCADKKLDDLLFSPMTVGLFTNNLWVYRAKKHFSRGKEAFYHGSDLRWAIYTINPVNK